MADLTAPIEILTPTHEPATSGASTISVPRLKLVKCEELAGQLHAQLRRVERQLVDSDASVPDAAMDYLDQATSTLNKLIAILGTYGTRR